MNFCSECGERVSQKIPAGDTHLRHVCDGCGMIHYLNPKLIAGTIAVSGDKILLCKRAIEPRYGFWTLPAGFMENDETVTEGAALETREEANAEVDNLALYTVASIPSVDQVHIFMKGDLVDNRYSAGEESLEVELFTEDEIPWDEIAFKTVRETLEHYFNDRKAGAYPVHTFDIERW